MSSFVSERLWNARLVSCCSSSFYGSIDFKAFILFFQGGVLLSLIKAYRWMHSLLMKLSIFFSWFSNLLSCCLISFYSLCNSLVFLLFAILRPRFFAAGGFRSGRPVLGTGGFHGCWVVGAAKCVFFGRPPMLCLCLCPCLVLNLIRVPVQVRPGLRPGPWFRYS
jgi:hypothetical protein